MTMTPERKSALIKEYATKTGDTGSPEVQVAILTERINTSHRPFQDPQERQPFPPRPAQDGEPAPRSSRLSEVER